MSKVIAIANQKGGCAKTTTAVNLAVALTHLGKKVLVIDADPQGSCTASLGYAEPDDLKVTLANIMVDIVNDEDIDIGEGILHHKEKIDLVPANIELSGLEVSLINVMSREMVMKAYVDEVKDYYDYVLIDCMPSLGMLTINALVAADAVIIPVQTSYLPVKGLEQLLSTISKVRRQLNKKLQVEGILLTMVDMRTVYARDMIVKVHETYGMNPKVGTFETYIPRSVRAEETSSEGVSIFEHRPDCKIARAYQSLAKEVVAHGHNYREVDGGQIGNIETMTMDYAVKEITDFYQLSDQKLIEMNRDKLADLVELYNPAFTDEQIQFMADVIGQGFDSKEYWVGGKPMDLSAERLSSDQIADIKYQVREDAIPKMLFTKEQWHEIEAGIADKADVTAYADPSLSPEQMRQKRMEMTAPKTPVKEEPVISESDRKTSTKQTGKRKSVLADLREKQARIGGGEAPQVQMKSKSKEME